MPGFTLVFPDASVERYSATMPELGDAVKDDSGRRWRVVQVRGGQFLLEPWVERRRPGSPMRGAAPPQ